MGARRGDWRPVWMLAALGLLAAGCSLLSEDSGPVEPDGETAPVGIESGGSELAGLGEGLVARGLSVSVEAAEDGSVSADVGGGVTISGAAGSVDPGAGLSVTLVDLEADALPEAVDGVLVRVVGSGVFVAVDPPAAIREPLTVLFRYPPGGSDGLAGLAPIALRVSDEGDVSVLPSTYGTDGLAVQVSEFSTVAWGLAPKTTAITTGFFHTCVLLREGTVQCWGDNTDGQLGDGTTTDSSTPVTVTGIANATAITAGWDYSCALLSDGTVQCWGDNTDGQLGDGTTTDSSTPVTVTGIANATAITAGGEHSCALLDDGSIECWGANGFGKLGNGDAIESSSPVAVDGITNATAIAGSDQHSCALLDDSTVKCWGLDGTNRVGNTITQPIGEPSTPVAVDGVTNATAIGSSCALLDDGSIQCWGFNRFGQLGNGDTNDSSTPVSVTGIANATAIVAGGGAHSCALLEDRTIQCWGFNRSGQLGNGDTTDSYVPVSVTGITNATAITADSGPHSCALLEDGTIQCWGDNEFGQLGDGTTDDSLTPVTVGGGQPSSPSAGELDAVGLSAGPYHACALSGDGAIQCWGWNKFGQLGSGDTTDSRIPLPVSGVTNATAVVAGDVHTCALEADGTVQCWGSNNEGQLGNGDTISSSTLVLVDGITTATATAIATGAYHSCALLSDATVQCWGANGSGQLGNGTTTDSSSPVKVDGITNATAIATGVSHSCALLEDRTVQCWGADGFGQLGNSDTAISSSTPVTVDGITNATAITTGGAHSCALLENGTIQCWGNNGSGQLGNGDTNNSSTPVSVTGTTNATTITASVSHSCALLEDGTVQCWGANGFGQLGNGDTTDSSSAVTVDGITNATTITTGGVHSCALLEGGTIQCWGSNFIGQLGNGTTTDSLTPVDIGPPEESKPMLIATTGDGEPFDNMAPSLTLNCLVAERGIFPSLSGDDVTPSWMLGSLRWTALGFAPPGWQFCDGQVVEINSNQSLFSLIGTNYGGDARTTLAIPDVRGRTPIGEGSSETRSFFVGSRFGVETVRLRSAELPAHDHGTDSETAGSTGSTGAGRSYLTHQPSLVLNCIVSLAGVDPTGGGVIPPDSTILGETMWVGFNFAPTGWASCDGQALTIADHPALFSLIGTAFGGDGATTFQLPDARGRALVGASADAPPGTTPGAAQVSLSVSELPSHVHPLEADPDGPTTEVTGGSSAPDNRQPALALVCIVSLQGADPQSEPGISPFIGEVRWLAHTTIPSGWRECDGGTWDRPPDGSADLSTWTIAKALMNTTFGDSGPSTLVLPDARGRLLIHEGAGPGLTPISLGETRGVDPVTLTLANVPGHEHPTG